MRNSLFFIATAMLLALSCAKDIKHENPGVAMEFSISIPDLAGKASYTPEGSGLKCSWEEGDSISIVSLNKGSVASVDLFTSNGSGATASFSGSFTGNKSNTILAVYPALPKKSGGSYVSRPLPGTVNGVFKINKGSGDLKYSADPAGGFSQLVNEDASHIALSDVMVGTIEFPEGEENGAATLRKHSSVLKVEASIAGLPAGERIRKLKITASGALPFTGSTAALPLSSASGIWSTEKACDSLVLHCGKVASGIFLGFKSDNSKLVAYVPVLPNVATAAYQGSVARELTLTVTTDHSVYSGKTTIPVKTNTENSFALEAGTLSTLQANLTRTGDASRDVDEWVRTINSVADVDEAADDLREYILASSPAPRTSGRSFYVSNAGSDSNNGLSSSSPVKTLNKVNSLSLRSGDAVLFRAGDTFRGHVTLKNGVTYSSYGTGPKPRIYGSPCNAAKEGSWTETYMANIYKYSQNFSDDAGTLVFNDGEAGCAYKVILMRDYYNNTFHPETRKPFSSWQDLTRDLDMYHDLNTGSIYLYSASGNPSTRFNSIEILTRANIFDGWGMGSNSTAVIDNLCIKYTGAHGVGTGSINSLTVTNCEIGWIGGSIQKDNPKPTSEGSYSRPTRYGNGVEIYGTCQYFRVQHNWIYQIYDAGATHQYSEDKAGLYMDNVSYLDNLIERCVYAIEYWITTSDNYVEQSGMRNFQIRGNILRMTGPWSWGYQRTNKDSPAAIKTWKNQNRASDFVMEGNIIDRGRPTLLNINATRPEWMPVCRANVYLQEEGVDIGTMREKNPKVIYVQP